MVKAIFSPKRFPKKENSHHHRVYYQRKIRVKMFSLSQLDTMLDPASHKDGFPNPDHVWTSFEVLVFLKAQVYWKDYDTPFSCFMLHAQFTHILIDTFKLPFHIFFSWTLYSVIFNYLMKTFVNKDSRKYLIVIHKIYFNKLYLAIKISVEFFNHI